jgi:hypothetical protein
MNDSKQQKGESIMSSRYAAHGVTGSSVLGVIFLMAQAGVFDKNSGEVLEAVHGVRTELKEITKVVTDLRLQSVSVRSEMRQVSDKLELLKQEDIRINARISKQWDIINAIRRSSPATASN